MKRLLLIVALLVPATAEAHSRFNGICELYGTVSTQGNNTFKVQKSYPGCTVTVYLAGSITLAPIFADNMGTVLPNPFTASNSTAMFFFYAANGAYDVKLSGGGIPSPFTIGGVFLFDPLDTPNVTLGNIIVTSCSGCGGGGGGGPTGPAGGDLTGTYPNPTIAANAVTYAKMQQVTAARLLGRQPGSTGNVNEITLGTNLSMTGTTLNATGGTTVTGSPVPGNLTQFSGATSITNGNLSGDVTTVGTLATTIGPNVVTYPKIQQVSAASTLLGRGSSGAGNVQEITVGAGLAMSGTTLSATGGGGGGGTINGTATVNQLAYGVSPNTISSNANLGYNVSTSRMNVGPATVSFTDPSGNLNSAKNYFNLDPTVNGSFLSPLVTFSNTTAVNGSAWGAVLDATSTGANNQSFLYGVDGDIYHQSTGTLGQGVGVSAYIETLNGTITNANTILVKTPLVRGSGSITNDVGILIQNQNVGTGTNLAIQTGTGQVSFGDAVNMNANAAYNVKGVSSTSTQSKNIAGTCTLSSGACTITFGTSELDANYRVSLAGNTGEGFYWGSKTTSGFTISSSNGSSTAIVDWHIFR